MDVVVVGAGPNGLAAAVELARAGHRVTVHEAGERIGGGTRSAELTLPGFVHDVCSAVHPLGATSPFFRGLPLGAHGLAWIEPPVAMAHPFDDGTAVLLARSVAVTGDSLGAADRVRYRRLVEPLAEDWEALLPEVLAPLRIPRRPVLMARFARHGLRSAQALAGGAFAGDRARALLLGIAAHALAPLDRAPTAAIALVLALAAHAAGWPVARGGSQRIADALAAVLARHGGRIVTASPVRSLAALGEAAAVLLDLTPRQVLAVAGDRLPLRYRRSLARYRYGPGVFKLDWALAEPIPWRAEACARAGTVHLGGSAEEVARSVAAAWSGGAAARPFVILAQPSRFDPTRAPAGRHVAWAYCRVPHGSAADLTDAVEAQVERFAPGFRETVLARRRWTAVELEGHNPNLVGGDIAGGVQDLRQTFFRPAARWVPYATPRRGLYLCSASTPPGGAVHGMCGYHAARAVLRDLARRGGGVPPAARGSPGRPERIPGPPGGGADAR
jgi:phytoene dehydrogenase-like protein